jgi:putative permease
MEHRTFDISWESLWRVLLFVVLIAGFYQGRQIILGLFLAIVISSGVEGIVDALARIGLPRSVSVILIFLITIFGLILVVYTLVPVLIVELNTIFSGSNQNVSGGLGFLLSFKSQSLSESITKLSSQFLSGSSSPITFFSNTLDNFALAFAVGLARPL